MGKCKDGSDFDKAQFVMVRLLGQSISQTAGVPSAQWLLSTKSGPRKGNCGQTSDKVVGAQGSLMGVRSEG